MGFGIFFRLGKSVCVFLACSAVLCIVRLAFVFRAPLICLHPALGPFVPSLVAFKIFSVKFRVHNIVLAVIRIATLIILFVVS